MSQTSKTEKVDNLPPAFGAEFLRWLPLAQWIVTALVACAVVFLTFRDGQTSQSAQINQLQQKTVEIERTVQANKSDYEKQFDDLKLQIRELPTRTELQNKIETVLKLQEMTRDDIKQLREIKN
jgi:peptidoglycan hydrolase CwlO-like protein